MVIFYEQRINKTHSKYGKNRSSEVTPNPNMNGLKEESKLEL